MQTNIEENLRWLRLTPTAITAGFEYAHIASTNITKPTTFNFETTKSRAAHNCALSSVSSIGVIDLDVYRSQEVVVTHNPLVPSITTHSTAAATITNTNTNNNVTRAPHVPSSASGYVSVQQGLDEIPDEMFLNIDIEGKNYYRLSFYFILTR